MSRIITLSILFASVGGQKETRIGVLRAARGGRWGPLPGRSVGRKPPSQGAAAERTPFGWGTRRFTKPPEPINCAGGVKRSSNERPLLRLFVEGPARRGMDARTDLRLVEIRERTRGCGPSAVRQSTASLYRAAQKARGLVALSDASPQTPSPASRQGLARRHQGSSDDP